ncbi:hypothetical protein SLEP1_g44014 [Rubroshorea leprosula]|uniref:ENT domain-containing protein n=1 Tax=Rubroshorea leprosula TaxID=152421 RepID=A0AAV5LEW1_9ROSI|nr:hypothetical protein SLEP1_g44014 [Rubroshorea leprosula]
MTKFSKGSKVEVLRRVAGSVTGSWLCGEIISGDGQTYSVKYGWLPTTSKGVVHEVPRKAIRPCPPPVERAGDWVSGDLVEVFDDPYWKKAVIVKVLGVNCFSVRQVGSSAESSFPRSHLRARRWWEDGRWFVIGKQKRRSDFEADALAAKKIGVMGKDGSRQISMPLHPSPLSGKVDTFVSPKKVLSKIVPHRMDVPKESRTLHIDSSASFANSFGSVSSATRFPICFGENIIENLGDNFSDAKAKTKSLCGGGFGRVASALSASGRLRTDIHKSELHAYRQVLQALYASGSFSWEEELRMTNLRSSLHISDDEHRMELRKLSRNFLSCY